MVYNHDKNHRVLSSVLCDDLDGWDGGREVQEGGKIRTHIADSLHCTVETNTALYSNYTPIKKKKKTYELLLKYIWK